MYSAAEAASLAPGSGHGLTAATVVILIMIGGTLDYMAAGPDRFRDKIAFLIILPAFRAGWDGSALDKTIVDNTSRLIASGLDSTGWVFAGAKGADTVLKGAVFCLTLYAFGMLAPDKWAKKLGRLATLSFSGKQSALKKMNPKIWIVAALLGILADLPGGLTGVVLRITLDFLTSISAGLPAALIGA